MPKISHVRFIVCIDSGDQDVVDNHEEVIRKCLNDVYHKITHGNNSGILRDHNGCNKIGTWGLELEYQSPDTNNINNINMGDDYE